MVGLAPVGTVALGRHGCSPSGSWSAGSSGSGRWFVPSSTTLSERNPDEGSGRWWIFPDARSTAPGQGSHVGPAVQPDSPETSGWTAGPTFLPAERLQRGGGSGYSGWTGSGRA